MDATGSGERLRSDRGRGQTGAGLALLVGLVLACGAPPAPTPAPTPGAPSAPAYRTGPTNLVLRIEERGGLQPWPALRATPSVSLYGDGTLIRPADEARIGYGHTGATSIPSIVVARLTPSAMARVLSAAGDAGLLGPDRDYTASVVDAPTTIFTLVVDGTRHTISVLALGDEEGAPASDSPARRRLADFDRLWWDLDGWLGPEDVETEAVTAPERLRVYRWGASRRTADDVRAWPLDAGPDVFGEPTAAGGVRCAVLDRQEAVRLGLDTATSATTWVFGGQTYQIEVRPLLPDQWDCQSGAF